MLWHELPAEVRDAVAGRTGRVTAYEQVTGGVNSDLTATLDTAGGRFFCKATRTTSRTAWMLRNELTVHPHLPDVAPALHWHVDTGSWLVLGFEHVEGRHPDFSPGSPDIAPVTEALRGLHAKLTPCPAKVASFAEHWRQLSAWQRIEPDDVDPWTRQHLDRFREMERKALDLAEGDTLLHTDLHPLNVLTSDRPRIVDWAWARRGQPWVDRAFLHLRLMLAGHEPHDDDVPDEFVVAVYGVWLHMRARASRARSRTLRGGGLGTE
jgi:Ser/Thr protein kinase RdoA (MazF antagonist)